MKLLITILLIIPSIVHAQSAWTQKKKATYLQVNYSEIRDYKNLFGDDKLKTSRLVTDKTLQFYGEYGFSDRLTVISNIPIKSISTGEINPDFTQPVTIANNSTTRLGNISFGARYNLYSNIYLVSIQFDIEANTSSYEPSSGLRTGFDAWTYATTFSIGRSWGESYFQAFSGFSFRTNDYSHLVRFGGEYGHKFLRRLWIIGFTEVIMSLKNGDFINTAQNLQSGLYLNDQEVGAWGIKGVFEYNKSLGFTGALGGAFSGNFVAKTPAYSLGAYYKF